MSEHRTDNLTTLQKDDLLWRATLPYWWQRRWFIIKTLTALAVVFALVLLAIPSRYRATAQVIILPPRFVPEVRTQPLAVPTAQALLETPDLYQQVLNTIKRQRTLMMKIAGESKSPYSTIAAAPLEKLQSVTGATETEATELKALDARELEGLYQFDEDELATLNAGAVGEMLSSEEAVEKKTASDVVYSPVVRLYAVADTGPKAQVLANTWARLFEKKYEALTRGQTQRLSSSLESQQEAGQQELEKIQQLIVSFRLENNVDLLQRQIRDKMELLSSFSQQLVGRQNELAVEQAKTTALQSLSASLEQTQSGWMGDVLPEFVGRSETGFVTAITTLSAALPAGTDIAEQVKKSQSDLATALQRARSFEQEHQTAYLQELETKAKNALIELKTELPQKRVAAESLRSALEQLEGKIASTSQTLTLSTSLPEEVIGSAVASGSESSMARAAALRYSNDRINPEWEELVKERAALQQQLTQAQAQVKATEALIPAKDAEVKQLGEQAFAAGQGANLARNQVEQYEQLNRRFFERYTEMKRDLLSSLLRQVALRQEIGAITSTTEDLRTTIEELRGQTESAEARLEILNLRKKAVEQRAQLLTQKLQESLVAIGEQVSDVSIASKAVAPEKHYFPPRTILLIAGMLLSAAVLLYSLSRRRYLELITSL